MPAPAAKLTFVPDIVEEHFDELQFLWEQRRSALRSASYRERELRQLEERIEARAQGLLVLGERLMEFVAPALAGDEEMPAFAAAVALLHLGTPAAIREVGDAFEAASGKKLDGLRDALASKPAAALTARLTAVFLSGAPGLAAAAGEVLAFHSAMSLDARYLERLFDAEEPAARAGAWRLVAYCSLDLPAGRFDAGLCDDDPSVKRAALSAAAWTRSPAFLPYCLALAAEPTPETIDALITWAAVAATEDYRLVAGIATNPTLGPTRFRVVSSFAHPYFVDLLVKEMESPDPVTAAAAGAAFTRMIGRDVESNTRVKVSPDGEPPADDFEAEFEDEVFLPDPELARKHWQELAPKLAHSPRICRGIDVSQPLSREQFAALDMESRWEYCLRMRLFSGWQGTPLVLERYPQRF